MIQRLSHSVIYVLDQDTAYDFYVNKLGFDVRTDNSSMGFRWLTVGPKGQPDIELVLMPLVSSPMVPDEQVQQMRELVTKGAVGCGVFQTADCRKTYEELSAKGVVFMQPPADRFYGVEALFKDNSAVLCSPSFCMRFVRWVSTVYGLTFNTVATSLLVFPSASSCSTSFSRSVSR
jgi:catechol 2,3-dioxygenase-like lactoylglutathione lyase family enzyme